MVEGKYDETRLFAGGNEFPLKDESIVRSSNLTPHDGTGLGGWSEAMFIQKFRMFSDSNYEAPLIAHKQMNTEMPWIEYAGMSDEELRAIWAYLRSLPPVENKVIRFTAEPPSEK